MSRSVRSCLFFAVAMISFASFGYAQTRTLPIGITHGPRYTVKLTATETTGGTSLATTVYSKPWDSISTAPGDLVTDQRLRYTFSAQRKVQNVCSDSKIILASSPSGNLNALKSALAAGQYSGFSVHVTGLPTADSVIGDATVTGGHTVVPASSTRPAEWIIYPPAGTKGPANVSITYKITSPPEHTSFQIHIFCGALCVPADGFSSASAQPAYSYIWAYKLSATMNPGSPPLGADINEFHIGWQGAPDCTWVRIWHASKSDYYLVP